MLLHFKGQNLHRFIESHKYIAITIASGGLEKGDYLLTATIQVVLFFPMNGFLHELLLKIKLT